MTSEEKKLADLLPPGDTVAAAMRRGRISLRNLLSGYDGEAVASLAALVEAHPVRHTVGPADPVDGNLHIGGVFAFLPSAGARDAPADNEAECLWTASAMAREGTASLFLFKDSRSETGVMRRFTLCSRPAAGRA